MDKVIYLGTDPDGKEKAQLEWTMLTGFLNKLLDESEDLAEAMEKLEAYHRAAESKKLQSNHN